MGINLDHYFKLPEDWSPDDFWCVTLRIPAGDDYVDDLNAALNELRFSRNFGRDPTREGAATVSRTWARALDWYNPIINREDCAVMGPGVVLRISPDGCRIEYQSCDDPDLWFPIDSGVLSSTTYDPRTDPFPVSKPPLFDPPTDACNSAVNVMAFMRQIVAKIIIWWNTTLGPAAGTGLTVPEFLVEIQRWIGEFMYDILLNYVTVAQTVFQGWQAAPLAAITWDAVEDDFNSFDWDDLVCAILPAFNDDGTFNNAAIDGVQSTIEGHYGENQMWYFFGIYWSFIASGPLQDYARSFFGITDGDCSPCDVSAIVTYDDGGYAYELPYGTIDSSGNPGNCALAESVNLPGPGWYTIARTKIFPPAGALNALSCDAKGFTADGFTIAIAGSLYYADDTIKASFSVEPGTMDDWTHVDLATAWGQSVAADEYLIVDIAVATGGADVAVFGTTLRIDNITMEA